MGFNAFEYNVNAVQPDDQYSKVIWTKTQGEGGNDHLINTKQLPLCQNMNLTFKETNTKTLYS